MADAIANGASLKAAAQLAEVDEATLCRWLQLGRQGRKPYTAFVGRVERARERNRARLVGEHERWRQEWLEKLARESEVKAARVLASLGFR